VGHGSGHGGGGGKGERRVDVQGKVSAVIYDRYGDFEGFVVDTEDGEQRFRSDEHAIEKLVRRAWIERIRTTVVFELDDPDRAEVIIFSGPVDDD
jgi:hypothetical protein